MQRDDFYPRPPRGGRRVTINGCIIRLYFYPRPPRGGRHLRFRHSNRPSRFLSTPSARRATDRRTQGPAGCRKFLSTPSARRATAGVMSLIFKSWKFLSTPSARRATWLSSLSARRWRISIHALREEGDLGGKAPITAYTDISIHALREEGDHKTIQYQPDGENFYPRPPRGGRPWPRPGSYRPCEYFYPRPPRGGRRCGGYYLPGGGPISIHALREEGDCLHGFKLTGHGNFYPRPPRGGRPRRGRCSRSVMLISIHALREEGD